MANAIRIPMSEYLATSYRPDREYVDPDLVVLRPGTEEAILSEPPLLTIGILSPDDGYSDLEERCNDYRAMGVETMWIIDPQTRNGRLYTGDEWREAERLEVAGTPIYVELQVLFSQVDGQAQSL